MDNTGKTEKKAALILGAIALFEGGFVMLNFLQNGQKFSSYLGFGFDGKSGTVFGWLLALMVAAGFVWLSLRLPAVRANLFRPSFLKLLALLVAVFAGILEELVFRKLLMDSLSARGDNALLQIILSGLAFGVMHGVWGLFGGSFRAALGATAATGLLGAALATVYIASERSLAPCIIAHFLINLLIEPGLVLAAASGEMGHRK